MAFGQELKDFVAAFSTGSDIMERRSERKRKERREPYELEAMEADTEYKKKAIKWYDRIHELNERNTESAIRAREQEMELAPKRLQSDIDYRDAQMFEWLHGRDDDTLTERQQREDAAGAVEEGTRAPTGRKRIPGAYDDSGAGGALPIQRASYGGDQVEVARALYDTAGELGVSPFDLAAVIDYETIGKWNPDIRGGKNNDYVGLIQFGPEERQAYGYRPNMSVAEQIRGPVKAYLEDRGVQSGHSVDEIYSIINAGSLKNGRPRYGASDGNGTVADHIDRIKRRNLPRVQGLFGTYFAPVQEVASGGLIRPVQALQIGGLVEDEEEEAPVQALPAAVPIPSRRPSSAVTEDTYDPAKAADPRTAGFREASQAVKEGMKYALKEFGLSEGAAVSDPARAAKMADYLKGKGAASASMMQQVYKAVDPDNELSESERAMAALATVHSYYYKQGEPDKAQAAAASMVQHLRVLSQQYTALAKAAASEGDMDGAVEAAVRAYAMVPDGRDLKVKKREDGRYDVQSIDEETGKTVTKTVLTPQEIGAYAMQVSPTNFDQFIMDAAGMKMEKSDAPSAQFETAVELIERGRTPRPGDMKGMTLEERNHIRQLIKDRDGEGKGGSGTSGGNGGGGGDYKPLSPAEITGVRDTIQSSWQELDERMQEEGVTFLGETPPEEADTIKGAATDIVAHPANRGAANVTPQDALNVALEISTFDQTMDQKQRRFTSQKEEGGYRVTLLDGRDFFVPEARYNQLDNIWKAYAKEYMDQAGAQRAEAVQDERSNRAASADDRILRNDYIAGQRALDIPSVQNPHVLPAPRRAEAIPMRGKEDERFSLPKTVDWIQELMGQ